MININNTVLIIKNISHENPGLILDVLQEFGIGHDIIDLTIGVKFPQIDNYSFIIVMGGPDSANDDSEKIKKELEYVKLAFEKKIPVFGICLGLQLMVKVNNGEILINPVKEFGFKNENKWYTISLTEKGLKDPIFKGIEKDFKVFQLHAETVKFNENIILLGTGEYCRNQIIKIGKFNYGFQFHLELTEELLNDWLILAPELHGQDKISIKQDFKLIFDSYSNRGIRIFRNYIKLLNLEK